MTRLKKKACGKYTFPHLLHQKKIYATTCKCSYFNLYDSTTLNHIRPGLILIEKSLDRKFSLDLLALIEYKLNADTIRSVVRSDPFPVGLFSPKSMCIWIHFVGWIWTDFLPV